MDAPAITEDQIAARAQLVELCCKMLTGQLSYFEGAVRVCAMQGRIRVPDHDPDIIKFTAIVSETNHLHLERSRQNWAPAALKALEPEFEKTEAWAKSFATEACETLIRRVSGA